MAISQIASCVDTYWVDNKPVIDTNFADVNPWYTITTAATPASGSCAVQFVFKQPTRDGVAGATINYPIAGIGYIATAADGLTTKAVTTIATLTNGRLLQMATVTSMFQYTTSAAGLLGMTITTAASNNYVVFILPNGRLLVSTNCQTT